MADELLQMFQSITTSDHDELVDQFAFLLQVDVATASFFLESSNWNVETAVNTYLSTVEPPGYDPSGPPGASADADMAMDDGARPPVDSDAPGGAAQPLEARFVSELAPVGLPPQAVVNMQWSFVNTGGVAWPADTRLVFLQGDRLEGPAELAVGAVRPGVRIDSPVTLQMPPHSGTVAGCWRLVSSLVPGSVFGDPVWVTFTVGPSAAKHPELLLPVGGGVAPGVVATDEDMMDL
ncbi:hypothetical protein P43SY_007667 [Pythium insidiosum]|uniref:Nbr1 FW domain-containing protein n=1 Tax=Pythium insidiosum TaxID=114742 RepID=A0AAD5M740_PYTIN|nr:hypothetical protein P43SY_007667 [Pythium insidiosum]